jgi:hypothetical protein
MKRMDRNDDHTWRRRRRRVRARVLGAGAGEAEEAVIEAIGRGGGGVVARMDGDGGGGVVEVVADVEGRGRRHPGSRSRLDCRRKGWKWNRRRRGRRINRESNPVAVCCAYAAPFQISNPITV